MSSVCLQDPFDRSHNVAKNMKAVHLQSLLQALKSSQSRLQELLTHENTGPQQNILSLFTETEPVPATARSPLHRLQLDMAAASRLLQDTCYEALAGRLQELDLSNKLIRRTMDSVVLQALAGKLETEFGFKVHSKRLGVLSTASVSPQPLQEEAAVQSSGHATRKRQRTPTAEGEEEEEMEVEGEGEGEEGEGVKRQRVEGAESAEQLLFCLTEGKGLECQMELSAVEESWIGRRRRRREKQRQTISSPEATVSHEMTTTPCLSFTLSMLLNQQPQCHTEYSTTVTLQAADPKFQISLQVFFSVCKNWLLSNSH